MNKKYLSVILFGALMLGTTGTFTSCKDYDDDINQINKELTDIKSAISELQSKVDNGKYVTNITKEGEGIKITWNDNSTSVIETIKGDKGADGTIVTIVDGYWAFDGVKSEYPATGKDGANGEDGKDGADGHDAKISEDGYWMVWDAEKGEYAKTEYIAGGATAIAGEHGWTIVVRDENGEEQRIYIPNSADLVGIEDALGEEGNYQIFYGLVNQAVDWDGAKGGADKKMQAGMYPVLDRNVMVMLNPTGVDATAYKFEFRPSDNKELWGLTFADMEPYAGEKLTRAASESGIWVLPRTIERVELTGLDQRVDYVTQFKGNSGERYAFALTATSKANASQVVKSQYIYTFDPKNVGDMDASDFHADQYYGDKTYYVWNEYHQPDFSSWTIAGGAVGDIYSVSLDQVIYDYKIEIDKTKMTQVNIDKYGLEISEDGYSFIAKKEAAIDNPVYLKVSFILVNGSKGSLSYFANITAKDMVITDTNIGTINEAFNAIYTTNSKITDLNGKYVLGAKELAFNPKEVLGTNYDEWVDAMYQLLYGYSDAGKANNLKRNVSILGGDPINNDATYNNYLVQNLLYFDYVDANGKSCIYDVKNADVLSKLADIAAVKVYFIAGTYVPNTDAISQSAVSAPFYTVRGTTSYYNDGFAIPLNNAFSVQVATAKEEQVVAAFTFKFQLTQPDIETVGIVKQEGEFTSWGANLVNGKKVDDVLISYGAYDATVMRLPMYEAFDIWTGKAPAIYTKKNANAQWFKLTMATAPNAVLFDDNTNKYVGTLADIDYVTDWKAYETYMNAAGFDPTVGCPQVPVNIDYHFFGVYPALAEQLPFYTDANGDVHSGFQLQYTSTIWMSSMEAKEATYYAKAGTHYVFISNDDIVAMTQKKREFVLFDGIDANGNVADRETLNDARGFNEDIRPFVDPMNYVVTAKNVGDNKPVTVKPTIVDMTSDPMPWVVDATTGTIEPKVNTPSTDAEITVYLFPSSKKYPVGDAAYPNGLPAVESGFVIQLGQDIDYRQPIEVTITVKDELGYGQDLKVVVQKLQ